MVRNSSMLSRSDRMDVIREAMNWGERGVSGNLEKVLFLRAVGKGKDREFFGDVWLKLLYADDPRQFTGRCGRVICTQEYIDHIERHIFGRDIPNYYGGRNGDRAYGRLITSSLENIAKAIERDLEQGARDNDYVQDENADKLKEALKDLERCGVRCYSLERKVGQLAWFVGGDPEKIRQLQQKLNELGIGERLKEDGVFGVKTLETWLSFINRLENGTVPTLKWVDPLKTAKNPFTNSAPVSFAIMDSKKGNNNTIGNAETKFRYFRVDEPHYTKNGMPQEAYFRGEERPIDYPHINVDFGKNPSKFQAWLKNRYNHYPLRDDAYNAVKDLQEFGKKVRTKSRTLLIAGVVLDTLEFGLAAIEDLTDTDKKLGKKTLSSAVGIGGRWIGATAGTKIGAAAGMLAGPAAPVAVPVLGLAGGLVGSFGGDALARWIVDITVAED